MPKEITRPLLAEALLSKNPPIVFEALDRKYFNAGHIPTARVLPLAEIDSRVASGPQGRTDRALLRKRDLPEFAPGRRAVGRARLHRCRRLSRRQAGLERGRATAGEITGRTSPQPGRGYRKPAAACPGFIGCRTAGLAHTKSKSRRRALRQHLAAEAKERRRSPAGGGGVTGRFDKLGALHETAEILFVQMAAGDGLDRACRSVSVKSGGISSNTTGRYFIFRAQPRDGRCKNSPVVGAHRSPKGASLRRFVAASRPSRRASSTRPASYSNS